jgi:ribosome-associated protein
MRVTQTITIAESELRERFVRASGPGGQNVNKVASAVELRFDAARSLALTDEIRERLKALAGSRMTADGILVIDARRFRTQAENREDARERLAALVRQASIRPRRRRKTRPTSAAVERRIGAQRQRGAPKARGGRIRAGD